MTQQLNSNDTVDTSTFISGETEATILGRVKFYGQEMEYVTDGKLFLLTTHANWRTRKNAKSFRFLLDCNIQTGRPRKLSATPDLSGTVLPLCPITNSASKSV
jgi:hypothetical protein